jgi:type I restriction-modification system DNA methylase subunit
MPLSWNEIRSRAVEFSQEYKDVTRENAETQSFYNEFFNVFGISRRRVASFEEPVKKLGTKRGRIDLFWKGTLLVEQKSGGRDLEAAYGQALDYFPNLKEEELPRYILVSDFQRFELYDLETGAEHKFTLAELHTKVELFGFIAGYQKREFKDQDPVNIEASERMGKLHDMLKDAGYTGHELELFLVRLLFCLFADDTTIFEKDIFRFYLEENTKEDGSDTGQHINHLFQVLNTPHERRGRNLNEALAAFPYVNGSLFEDMLPVPDFNAQMRASLISACYFNWGLISPAIFGSLFQFVMDAENKDKRRGIGAHYTTEKNILKILKPLFLDAFYAEFETARRDRRKLQTLHGKLASLTFLDPACGCGNFLILAYRELRLLEIEVLKALHTSGQRVLDVSELSRINVDAFYGIEIEEFPARIAEVALWLMDHQMNMRLSEAFGLYYTRIPLRASAHIHNANALKLDWAEIVPPERLSYILGNPPFVAKHLVTTEQRQDIDLVFHGVQAAGLLDYVATWYLKAARYIQGTRIVCGFVSTNSITQGEQVGILWQELFNRYHVKIHFAHRTFAWSSEARGKAVVHCVIVGFAAFDVREKLLYEYDAPNSEAHEMAVNNISPYLVEAGDFAIEKRTMPIVPVPPMVFGNKPVDDGNFFFTDDEKAEFLAKEPDAASFFRPLLSAKEYLHGDNRWCLWLQDINPAQLQRLPYVKERVERVRKFRLSSRKKYTQDAAAVPTRFEQVRQPSSEYILVPRHTSEQRSYVPFGFFAPYYIVHDSCSCIPDATLYDFGVLSSAMHMAWMRAVCGRIKSDIRYSGTLVYNNFPWPQPTPAQMQAVEKKAQSLLDARSAYTTTDLATLYHPLTMPEVLTKAHRALDRAVDIAYRKQPFDTERHRVEYLFGLYQQLTAPLIDAVMKQGRKRK